MEAPLSVANLQSVSRGTGADDSCFCGRGLNWARQIAVREHCLLRQWPAQILSTTKRSDSRTGGLCLTLKQPHTHRHTCTGLGQSDACSPASHNRKQSGREPISFKEKYHKNLTRARMFSLMEWNNFCLEECLVLKRDINVRKFIKYDIQLKSSTLKFKQLLTHFPTLIKMHNFCQRQPVRYAKQITMNTYCLIYITEEV